MTDDGMQQRIIEKLEKNPELLKKLPSGSLSMESVAKTMQEMGLLSNEQRTEIVERNGNIIYKTIVDDRTSTAVRDANGTDYNYEKPEWGHRRKVVKLTADNRVQIPAPGVPIENCGVYYCTWAAGLPQLRPGFDLNRKLPNRTLYKGDYCFDAGTYTFSPLDDGAEIVICYRPAPAEPVILAQKVGILTGTLKQSLRPGQRQVARGVFSIPTIAPFAVEADPGRFIRDLGVRGSLGEVFVKCLPGNSYLTNESYTNSGATYTFSPSDAGRTVQITYEIFVDPSSYENRNLFEERRAQEWVDNLINNPPRTLAEGRTRLANLDRLSVARPPYLNLDDIERLRARLKEQIPELEEAEREKVRLLRVKRAEQEKQQRERNQKAARVQEQIRLLQEQARKIQRGEAVEEVEVKPKPTESSNLPSISTDPRRRKIILE